MWKLLKPSLELKLNFSHDMVHHFSPDWTILASVVYQILYRLSCPIWIFAFEWNVLTTVGWIPKKLISGIHIPFRMTRDNSGEPIVFIQQHFIWVFFFFIRNGPILSWQNRQEFLHVVSGLKPNCVIHRYTIKEGLQLTVCLMFLSL